MNLRTQALKATLWSTTTKWGTQGISFVTLLVLARLLGPQAFGVIAIASVFITLLQTLSEQGFSQAIIQHRELEPEHLDTAFWICIGLAVFSLILLWGLADSIAGFYSQPELGPVIHSLAVLPMLSATSSIQMAVLKRSMDFKTIGLRAMIATGAGAVVGVGMALSGFGLWSLVARYLTNALLVAILLWSVGAWRPRLAFSRRHFNDLWSFSIHVFGFRLVMQLNERLDVLLIGFLATPAALGTYSVGKRITATLLEAMTGSVSQVALPVFSRVQHDDERLRRTFLAVTQAITVLTLPLFASLAILSEETVSLVLGLKWVASAPVVSILAVGGIMAAALSMNNAMMLAKGRSGTRLLVEVLTTILSAVAILVSYPHGIAAIALALILTQTVMVPLRLVILKRLIGLHPVAFLRCLAPSLRATVGLAFAINAVCEMLPGASVPTTLLIAGSAGIASYIGVLWVFDRDVLWYLINLAKTARQTAERASL